MFAEIVVPAGVPVPEVLVATVVGYVASVVALTVGAWLAFDWCYQFVKENPTEVILFLVTKRK